MFRKNLGRIDESMRYPFGELSVKRRQLICEVLHETSVLEVGGHHFSGECLKELTHKTRWIACVIRRDICASA
jgi:hypothetical protein